MQPDCVTAINAFIEEFQPSGLVVCCRLNEYRWLPERLKLNGAISLEPLSAEEVRKYLTNGGSNLAALREAMNADPVLEELAETPLMLSIMSLAYQGASRDELARQTGNSPEERRKQFFRFYVEEMFRRREKASIVFPKEKIIGWLSWLAGKMREHSQSVFLVEGLQPSWLDGSLKQVGGYVIIVNLIAGLLFGLIGKLIAGLSLGLNKGLVFGLRNRWFGELLFGLVGVGSVNFSLFHIALAETISWKWNRFWKGMTPRSILDVTSGSFLQSGKNQHFFFYLVQSVVVLSLWLTIGMCAGMAVWRWYGHGLIGGLIGLMSYGLFYGFIGGFTDRVKAGKASPNQGNKLSLKNSLTPFLITCLTFGLITGLISGPSFGLSFGLIGGPLIGFLVGLNRGGSAVIKHYALRLILWLNGYTPFKFIKFLDQCAKLILLKKVGGGYIFIHRMMLDYFADIPTRDIFLKR
jgi:eukaryotic-like serine/threonine-protein kinase